MFARFLLAAIAFLVAAGSHAKAAALISGTYYEEVQSNADCTGQGGSQCRINFSQTPSDKLLVVSRVTCSLHSSYPPGRIVLQISATSGGAPIGERSFDLAPIPRSTSATNWFTQMNETVHFLIDQGKFPYITVDLTGVIFPFRCTLIGDLTPIH